MSRADCVWAGRGDEEDFGRWRGLQAGRFGFGRRDDDGSGDWREVRPRVLLE